MDINEIKRQQEIGEINRKAYEQTIRAERMTKGHWGDDGVLSVPVSVAVETALFSNMPDLLRTHEYAKEHNISQDEAYDILNKGKTNPKSMVKSATFIGGNGIGKTETVIDEVVKDLKRRSMNPIIFDGRDLRKLPKNDNDVLILYYSCVGVESHEIKGIPSIQMEERTEYWNGMKQYEEVSVEEGGEIITRMHELKRKVPTLQYSEAYKLSLLKEYKHAVLIFDERNRSPEVSHINAILAGEPVAGFEYPQNMLVFALENSSNDRLNQTYTVDGAGKTKSLTYMVYQTAKDWARYAQMKGLHPAVISFVLQNEKVFETQMDNNVEIAFPTYRGAAELSRTLYNLEKQYSEMSMPVPTLVVQSQAQAAIGNYPKRDIARDFAHFYQESHVSIISALENTLRTVKGEFEFGLGDDKDTAKLIAAGRTNSERNKPYYDVEKYGKFDKMSSAEADKINLRIASGRDYIINFTNKLFGGGEYNVVKIAQVTAIKDVVEKNGKDKFAKELGLTKEDKEILDILLSKSHVVDTNRYLPLSKKLNDWSYKYLEEDINEHLKSNEEISQFADFTVLGVVIETMFLKLMKAMSPTIEDQSKMRALRSILENEVFIDKNSYGFELVKKLYPTGIRGEDQVYPMSRVCHELSRSLISINHAPYMDKQEYIKRGLVASQYDKNENSDKMKTEHNVMEYHEVMKIFKEHPELEIFEDFAKDGKPVVSEIQYNNMQFLYEGLSFEVGVVSLDNDKTLKSRGRKKKVQ